MKDIFAFCFRYLRPRIGKLTFYIIVSAILGLIAFVNPYIIGRFIDTLNENKNEISYFLWRYAVIVIIIGIVQFVLGYIKNRLYNIIQIGTALEINMDAIHHIQQVSTKERRDTAFLNQQINTDANYITMFCMNTLQNIIVNLITIIGPFVIVFMIDSLWVLLLLLLNAIYVVGYHFLKREMNQRSMHLLNSQSEFFSRLHEQLFNIRFIQIHGIAETFVKRLKNSADNVLENALHLQNTEYGFEGMDTIITSIETLLAIVLGGMAVKDSRISIGELTMILSFLAMSMNATSFFFTLGQDVQEISASKDRLENVFSEKKQHNGKEKMEAITSITCNNLSFGYTNRAIIENKNFIFEKGKMYAIVGENGIGKSTIIDLLLGLYIEEYQGNIEYNGTDIRALDMHNLRKNLVGVSEQEPVLLPETLEYNLTLDDSRVISQEELTYYSGIIGLDTYLSELDDGLKTLINEQSSNLSGGEKQKISLLRSFLKHPDVLMLDEPTSAMDKESKLKFLSFLKDYRKDKIIILVTHDREIAEMCDEVITVS